MTPQDMAIECDTLYLDNISFPALELWDVDLEIDLDLIQGDGRIWKFDHTMIAITVGKVDITTSIAQRPWQITAFLTVINQILEKPRVIRLLEEYEEEQQNEYMEREPWF